jgi:hypothetical protein
MLKVYSEFEAFLIVPMVVYQELQVSVRLT